METHNIFCRFPSNKMTSCSQACCDATIVYSIEFLNSLEEAGIMFRILDILYIFLPGDKIQYRFSNFALLNDVPK